MLVLNNQSKSEELKEYMDRIVGIKETLKEIEPIFKKNGLTTDLSHVERTLRDRKNTLSEYVESILNEHFLSNENTGTGTITKETRSIILTGNIKDLEKELGFVINEKQELKSSLNQVKYITKILKENRNIDLFKVYKNNNILVNYNLYSRFESATIFNKIWSDKNFYYHLFNLIENHEYLKFENQDLHVKSYGTIDNNISGGLSQIEFLSNGKIKLIFSNKVTTDHFLKAMGCKGII